MCGNNKSKPRLFPVAAPHCSRRSSAPTSRQIIGFRKSPPKGVPASSTPAPKRPVRLGQHFERLVDAQDIVFPGRQIFLWTGWCREPTWSASPPRPFGPPAAARAKVDDHRAHYAARQYVKRSVWPVLDRQPSFRHPHQLEMGLVAIAKSFLIQAVSSPDAERRLARVQRASQLLITARSELPRPPAFLVAPSRADGFASNCVSWGPCDVRGRGGRLVVTMKRLNLACSVMGGGGPGGARA
jgi:hypothetical protein